MGGGCSTCRPNRRKGEPGLGSTMIRLFALDGGLRRHPRVAQWFAQPPAELRGLALRWFEEMRSCGPDVMELLHDGQPTVCVANVALGGTSRRSAITSTSGSSSVRRCRIRQDCCRGPAGSCVTSGSSQACPRTKPPLRN